MPLTRLRLPGVKPLQVWNVDVGGGLQFWQAVGTDLVQALRRNGVAEAAIVRALGAGIGLGCKAIARTIPFERVHLAGGLTLLPGIEAQTRFHAPDVLLSFDPHGSDYAGAYGRAMFGENAIVLDIGQTALKGFSSGIRLRWHRDIDKMPIEGTAPADAIAFIVRGLAVLLADDKSDGPVLLSMAAPVSADFTIGETSYGLYGHSVHEIVDAANLWDREVYVINDAELAAYGARSRKILISGRTLVLTLGLGPGASVLTPDTT